MSYYEDCIYEAFEDAKITATNDQKDTVVFWVEGCVENEGMATGRDAIPNPLKPDLDRISAKNTQLEDDNDRLKHRAGMVEVMEDQIRDLRYRIRQFEDALEC